MVVIHAIQPIHANWWIIWLFVLFSIFLQVFNRTNLFNEFWHTNAEKKHVSQRHIFFYPTILCYLFSNICLTSKNKGDSWHFNSDSFFSSPYFGSHVTRTNTHCNGESFELTNAFQSMSKFILPVRWDECSPSLYPHKTPQAMNWNYIIYHLNWQRGGICIGLKLLNYVILN